ncbi:hypothetical protein GALL_415190 [mine drainage metagenome]|uniref:Uncharacterized protein n=1 Tax=mine drainage metagenome TaxID=410659 RepID=A0A1J5Q0J9_9ZZZZ
MVGGSPLDRVDAPHRGVVGGVGGQAVDGFGRNGDQLAGLEPPHCGVDLGVQPGVELSTHQNGSRPSAAQARRALSLASCRVAAVKVR